MLKCDHFKILPVSVHSSSEMKILILLHKLQAATVDYNYSFGQCFRERDIQTKTDAKKGCQGKESVVCFIQQNKG